MTDTGRKRNLNEDTFLIDEQLGLWVLADGMGGYGSGDIASQITVKHIVQCIKHGYSLVDSINSAHDAVLEAAKQGRGNWGMGTTVVVLRVINSDYEIAWIGDSRAYLFEDNQMYQLSKDHSLVQEMVDEGEITQEQAEYHPDRNIISQAVGSPEIDSVRVDIATGKLLAGNSILLCSDGLTTEVKEVEIARILQLDIPVETKVKTLIKAALDSGGKDNVTVVIVEKGLSEKHIKKTQGVFRHINNFFKKIR